MELDKKAAAEVLNRILELELAATDQDLPSKLLRRAAFATWSKASSTTLRSATTFIIPCPRNRSSVRRDIECAEPDSEVNM